jgi:Mor family transcriptional regulator
LKKELLENITIDDMPNQDMKLVAELCGIDVAVKLLQELGGVGIMIPKFGFRKVIQKYICDNFDGTNAKRLALELGVSLRFIYTCCDAGRDDSRQTSFLEGK